MVSSGSPPSSESRPEATRTSPATMRKQRGFSGAVAAANRQAFAGRDGKIHAGEDVASAAPAGQIGGGKPHQQRLSAAGRRRIGRVKEGCQAGDARHVIEHSLPIWHKSRKALISRTAVGGASATLSASGHQRSVGPVPAINLQRFAPAGGRRDGKIIMASLDSFKCLRPLKVGSKTYAYYSLPVAEKNGLKGISRLPFSLKVLLENMLRNEDGRTVTKEDILAVAQWLKTKTSDREIAFRPARVLMQDFTGVPAVVDLAAMRDAMKMLGGDPKKINPLVPVDLVIDHSVVVNFFGSNAAFKKNVDEEYKQNQERYRFLKWAQRSFEDFRVVPPGTGICHQVNLEYLSQTVWTAKSKTKFTDKVTATELAYPDTLVGTNSHTTMVNGLSVLGWGVGGIEAEAAMLGQPYSMLLPEVIGVRFSGKLKEGVTATDLVLTVTQMLRKRGVVGKFVEYFGPGLASLSIADRATLGNMAPEYGATCGFFPIDEDTIRYLRETGRAGRSGRAGARLCQSAGHVPHQVGAGSGLYRRAQARTWLGRAVACRAEAAAGSRAAQRGQDRLSPRPWIRNSARAAKSTSACRSRAASIRSATATW